MTRNPARARLLLVLAAACLGPACSGDDTLPLVPEVIEGADAELCAAATGTATLTLSSSGIRIVENHPAQRPVDRVEVTGTVAGLGAGEGVWVALLPLVGACPFGGEVTAVVAPGGTFTAAADLEDFRRFRVVAIAAATPFAVTCDQNADCLGATGLAGVSNTIEVRLQ